MASNPSYQLLANQEDDADDVAVEQRVESSGDIQPPSEATPLNTALPPPPYVSDGSASNVAVDLDASNELPPQYVDVVKLPTYHESEELLDEDNGEEEPENTEPNSRFVYWFLPGGSLRASSQEPVSETGSDVAFMFSFLLALIFNWLGFLLSYCFTRSLASYYGAISGFGLSLVKWAFIARRSEFSREFMAENPWFCYAFVLFGWVIFIRGVFAYIQMKRMGYRAT